MRNKETAATARNEKAALPNPDLQLEAYGEEDLLARAL